MGTAGISFGNITEIVFENRFRQYGAYMLRKTYSDRLMIAMITGISAVVLLVSTPLIIQLFKDDVVVIDTKPETQPLTQIEVEIVRPKPEIKELPKPKTVPTPPTKGVSSRIVASNTVDPNKNNVNLINDSLIAGDPNGKKEPEPIKTITEPKEPTGTSSGNEPYLVVEVDPIPGCDIKKHVASKLRYPQMAKDAGAQGTVYVSFIVNEQGNVTDVKVLKDIGYGCGDAAADAVRSMCGWQPGKMGGRPVKVLFNMPVKFTLH
jgi:protein TonB